jgi:hypothetical protein
MSSDKRMKNLQRSQPSPSQQSGDRTDELQGDRTQPSAELSQQLSAESSVQSDSQSAVSPDALPAETLPMAEHHAVNAFLMDYPSPLSIEGSIEGSSETQCSSDETQCLSRCSTSNQQRQHGQRCLVACWNCDKL